MLWKSLWHGQCRQAPDMLWLVSSVDGCTRFGCSYNSVVASWFSTRCASGFAADERCKRSDAAYLRTSHYRDTVTLADSP